MTTEAEELEARTYPELELTEIYFEAGTIEERAAAVDVRCKIAAARRQLADAEAHLEVGDFVSARCQLTYARGEILRARERLADGNGPYHRLAVTGDDVRRAQEDRRDG